MNLQQITQARGIGNGCAARLRWAAFVLAATLLPAGSLGQGEVSAPLLGYVPGNQNAFLAVGLPGAAHVLPTPGHPVSMELLVAARETALGVDDVFGEVIRITPDGAAALSDVETFPDTIALSPMGKSAVLWYADPGEAVILTGNGFAQRRTVDLPFLAGRAHVLAISDDAEWIAGVWEEDVFAIGPDGESVLLSSEFLTLAFAAGSRDLIAASASRLWHLDQESGFATTMLADLTPHQVSEAVPVSTGGSRPQDRGVADRIAREPAGVGTSADGAYAIAALRNGKIVRAPLPADGIFRLEVTDCRCRPQTLTPLNGGVFLVTIEGELKLYDPSRPRMLTIAGGPPSVGDTP